MFKPRPEQEEILKYTGGRLGVSAVPGSGKTHTLSYLAARLVRLAIRDDQEVLVVTFANSAVDNFNRRIREFLQTEHGLIPDVGYRVRTLHGLAHDIIRERPALLGLPEDFQIADERESNDILDGITTNWLRANAGLLDEFISPDIEADRRRWLERERWPELVRAIAAAFIRRAKDLQASPAALRLRLPAWGGLWSLARMGVEIYEDYQRALMYRGKVDFDDLVRLALEALQIDRGLLTRLQARWPYILEDEAQDSSELQEKILRLLTTPLDGSPPAPEGGAKGWVRVGDPNQAINTTFTTSDIRFLNQFLDEPNVTSLPLHSSGRSTRRIIDLANYLVDWTTREHPHAVVRKETFRPQHILPTPPDDPQPNPTDSKVVLHHKPLSPERELRIVVDSLARWLPDHADWTVAALVPDNRRGFKLAERLGQKGIPYDEMLKSTSSTRQTARAIERVLRYLAEPLHRALLSGAYQEWAAATQADALPCHKAVVEALRHCHQVESFVWPRPDRDWLSELPAARDAGVKQSLLAFRQVARRWLNARALPIDQLILTVAQDLFHEPAALALAHKMAVILREVGRGHPDWRLNEMCAELATIAANQQRFLGFSEDDLGFTPRAGRVTVATMHKAKGLEWDRVYLLGVNNYDFPSVEAHDTYRGETWYIRAGLNLEAEAIAQLEALTDSNPDAIAFYAPGRATNKARIEYTQERLRLLYVGITRAKKELVITWNVGDQERLARQAAAPFLALYTYVAARANHRDDADGDSR